MGLCKCPKRKVTNLFCFGHKVNVCEHCLVANHGKCIVKSYLQWLQDSDYSALCTLCHQTLSDDECVRLVCYDVFHWRCLNKHAQQLPGKTAPAGYTCPACATCIFPQPNLVSPVADALRALLRQASWAHTGLGLPLIEETSLPPPPPPDKSSSTINGAFRPFRPFRDKNSTLRAPGLEGPPDFNSKNKSDNIWMDGSRAAAQVAPYVASSMEGGSHQHNVISVDEGMGARVQQDRGSTLSNPRRLFDTTKEDDVFGITTRPQDHDEDKYKRRPTLQWLTRWFRTVDGKKHNDPHVMRKRFAVVLLLGLLGFLTVVIIFARLGRRVAQEDPFLDPLANPNIRVQHEPGPI